MVIVYQIPPSQIPTDIQQGKFKQQHLQVLSWNRFFSNKIYQVMAEALQGSHPTNDPMFHMLKPLSVLPLSAIESIQIRTPSFICVIYVSTFPPSSGFPIQAVTLVLLPKPLLQLLKLFWAQHTIYAGPIYNDLAEKEELSSLMWFSEIVHPHVISGTVFNC